MKNGFEEFFSTKKLYISHPSKVYIHFLHFLHLIIFDCKTYKNKISST